MLFLYSYCEKNFIVAICSIEQIVGKLGEVQGNERGRIGRTRMEEHEITSDLIKNQYAMSKLDGVGPVDNRPSTN